MKYRIISISGFFRFECQHKPWWSPSWFRLKIGKSGWFVEKDRAIEAMHEYLRSGGKVVWVSTGRLYLEKEFSNE